MSASLLYQNFLTPSMLSATSYAAASAAGVTPSQAGSVVFSVQGAYTGILNAFYVVQMQNVDGTGTLTGSTYRWSDSGGASWNAENVVPVPGTFVTLNNGLQIRFTNGVSLPYVVAGDTWTFPAIRKWGVAALVDWSRNTEFRSATVADGSTFDLIANLGSALTPEACVLYDHNLLATTVTRLQSSNASNFASLMHNELIPWQAGKKVIFPAASAAQYWRLRLTIGVGQGDIRLSEWYLGPRITVEAYQIGFGANEVRLSNPLDLAGLTAGQGVSSPTSEGLDVIFPHVQDIAGGDYQKLHTTWQTLNDQPNGDLRPCYLITNDTDLAKFGLYHWVNEFDASHRVINRYDVHATFAGLARSLS